MARRTIGYHVVKSGYGLWLPGDERGSWSDAWDDMIGYIQPHTLHEGDPARTRMAQERMQHEPVTLNEIMIDAVISAIGTCAEQSQWSIVAASIEPTHTHLLITYGDRDIHTTAKWIADQTTKAVHGETQHQGPVWAKGKWCSYVFDESQWQNTIHYIQRHNVRRGLDARPYGFVVEPSSAVSFSL